jgi:serine/threonine protein kinase HipA of HipAB toxin-antitoxin module
MEHNILTATEADLDQQKAVDTVIALGKKIEREFLEAERQARARKACVSDQAPEGRDGSGA